MSFIYIFFFNLRSIHEVDNISLDNSSFVKCSPVCNNLADAFLKKTTDIESLFSLLQKENRHSYISKLLQAS